MEAAGEIGLDGDFFDVFEVTELYEGLLIIGADQGFAPGGEEEAEAGLFLGLDKVYESGELCGIGGERFSGIFVFGEGTVGAIVIAAGKGTAV